MFKTKCPYCDHDTLYVVYAEVEAGGVVLCEDGFDLTEGSFMNTSEERVQCGSCKKEFPLSEVTE